MKLITDAVLKKDLKNFKNTASGVSPVMKAVAHVRGGGRNYYTSTDFCIKSERKPRINNSVVDSPFYKRNTILRRNMEELSVENKTNPSR